MAKNLQLNVRVDAYDRTRLAQLAAHYNISEASVLRMLIKREADSLKLTR